MNVKQQGSDYINRIRIHYDRLSPSERKLADYLLTRDTEEPLSESVRELASKVGISEPTIVRFCKRLGYEGYAELKLMSKDIGFLPSIGNIVLNSSIDTQELKEDVSSYVSNTIIRCVKMVEETALSHAISAICNTKRLIICGSGLAGGLAVTASHSFMNIGIPATAITEEMSMLRTAVLLEPGDVLLGISSSGFIKPVVDMLMTAQEAGATTILITSTPNREALGKKYADCILNCGSYGVPGVLDMLTTVSVHLAVLQILEAGCVAHRYDESMAHIRKVEHYAQLNRYDSNVVQVIPDNIRL